MTSEIQPQQGQTQLDQTACETQIPEANERQERGDGLATHDPGVPEKTEEDTHEAQSSGVNPVERRRSQSFQRHFPSGDVREDSAPERLPDPGQHPALWYRPTHWQHQALADSSGQYDMYYAHQEHHHFNPLGQPQQHYYLPVPGTTAKLTQLGQSTASADLSASNHSLASEYTLTSVPDAAIPASDQGYWAYPPHFQAYSRSLYPPSLNWYNLPHGTQRPSYLHSTSLPTPVTANEHEHSPFVFPRNPLSAMSTRIYPPPIITQQRDMHASAITGTDCEHNNNAYSSSVASTEAAGLKRKRVSRACDICWAKKIKCVNNSQSDCESCSMNGFKCTYVRHLKRRGPKSINPFESEKINKRLVTQANVVERIQRHLSAPSDQLFEPLVPSMDLIDLFYDYVYPAYPVIPKSHFLKNVNNESPLLLLAMYSTASRYRHLQSTEEATDSSSSISTSSPVAIFDEGKKYYQLARNQLDRYLDAPSFSSVLAFRLLGTFALSLGELHAARMFYSMSITCAKELELFDLDTIEQSRCLPYLELDVEIEIKRRMWWSCIMSDMKAAAATSRPLTIPPSQYRVPLPYPDEALENSDLRLSKDEERKQMEAMASISIPTHGIPILGEQALMITLMRITQQIIEYHKKLPLSSLESLSPQCRESKLQQLDTALSSWVNSLPKDLKTLNIEAFVCSEIPPSKMPWGLLCLHFSYESAYVMLHKDKLSQMMEVLTHDPSLAWDDAAKKVGAERCLSSLESATRILMMAIQVNPELLFLSAYTGQFIYTTGLSHAELGRLRPIREQSVSHINGLEIHVQALQALGRYWIVPGQRMGRLLAQEMEEIRRIQNE